MPPAHTSETYAGSTFDEIAHLAAQVCDTPIALVCLVEQQRYRLAACVGLDVTELPPDLTFHDLVSHDPQGDEAAVRAVHHLAEDPRFASHQLVRGAPHLRFLAYAPLHAPEGPSLGALCVLDKVPRSLDPAQASALRTLAQQVAAQIDLRRLKQESAEREAAYQHALALHQATIDTIADAVLVVSTTGQILHTNRAFPKLWATPDHIIATGDDSQSLGWALTQVADPDAFLAKVQELYATPLASSTDILHFRDGRVIERYSHPHVVNGTINGRVWAFRDVTARVRAEAEEARLRDEIIQAQAATLAALSTPLIPLSPQVVLMPMIGAIDPQRAQRVVEVLLAGVAAQRTRVAILDISGVPVVDADVAQTLVQAARSVQLLGAQAIVTGIRPEVAQMLVGVQVDLKGVVTYGTLQAGLRAAFLAEA